MNLDPVANITFMQALYKVIEALGKREQFEHAPSCYVTIEPGGNQPWPLAIRAWNETDSERRILVAHYYFSHGSLKPYPEFVLSLTGQIIWQRSVLGLTHIPAGDTSRDYQLAAWAETLREVYLPVAMRQRAEGRADRLLFLEEDVLGSIEEQRHSTGRQNRSTWMTQELGRLRAFGSFLENREAVRNAIVQATYLALREPPEAFYLVCDPDGTWRTLSESDLASRVRWLRHASTGDRRDWLSARIVTVMDEHKMLVSDFVTQTTGVYGGFVTDVRTLPQLAAEFGHPVHSFIEQEVSWHLDRLLEDMRHTLSIAALLARDRDDEDGALGVGAVV